MTKEVTTKQAMLNLSIIALVSLVAIVGILALVLHAVPADAATDASASPTKQAGLTKNIAGAATDRCLDPLLTKYAQCLCRGGSSESCAHYRVEAVPVIQ